MIINMWPPKIVLKQTLSLCFFCLAITACTTNESAQSGNGNETTKALDQSTLKTASEALHYSDEQHALTAMSESGDYRFTLYSQASPIPLKKIHSWILKVETKSGEPIEKAKLFVFGGMPQHQHGFPTKPRIKKYLGEGKYLVEGIKFSMPGYWEMRFNMKLTRIPERVIFKINLR